MNFSWIPLRGILLYLNLFFTPAAVTRQDILEAIEHGNLAVIQGFIEAGVNFNQTITDSTPLIYASNRDSIEIARVILAAPGTDINYPTRFGEPLFILLLAMVKMK